MNNAEALAKDFNCDFAGLTDLEDLKNMDIIINATSVGFDKKESIVDKNLFNKNQIVFDVIPDSNLTHFLKDAKSKGARIIKGTDMGLYQAVMQFEMYTGKKAPIEAMRKANK
jgi:shikimate dehydrogenase